MTVKLFSALIGAALSQISFSSVAADLPFGLFMGVKASDVPALAGNHTRLTSKNSIMGRGSNCVDHFLVGNETYPSVDREKFKENIPQVIQRIDFFIEMNLKLYEADVAGNESIYRKVCFGFVNDQLSFLQIPLSSLADTKSVELSISNRFREVSRLDGPSVIAKTILWEKDGVNVSWVEANPLNRMYLFTGGEVGYNRLRYVGRDLDIAKIKERLIDFHAKNGEQIKKNKDF